MSKLVLIADDAALVRTKLSGFFQGEGFEVMEAEDGKQALEIAEQRNDISLVVTDLNMPFLNGMDLAKKVRAIESYSKIPIFVLSTESTKELKKKGKEAGVTAWILKPFDPNSLREIMKALGI